MNPSRLKSVFIHFAGEVLPPTLFFVVGANLVKALVRLAYAPDTLTAWTTLVFSVTAVVAAKAVILLDLIPFMRRLDDRPLIQPILFKACFYFLGICLLRVIEHTLRDPMNFRAMIENISAEQWSGVVSLNGWIFTLCLIYAFIHQLNQTLDGQLLRIVFVSSKK